jgi:Cdc6-like AAA superfamily ATPase
MTGTGRYAGNPFSPVAVAVISDTVSEGPNIPTTAIRQAERYLDDYLTPEKLRNAGSVLAVSGEHGTGKTHLAMRLVRRARRAEPPVSAMYLDVASDTFTGLYSRFLKQLGRDAVRKLVNDYYADIVADSLASGSTFTIAEHVRSGGIDPGTVVGDYHMMESALLRKVSEELVRELRTITDNVAYGAALTLLLRPGYDDAVWDWLNGGAPHAALVERGITNRIDDEVSALDALGVFALLHGRKNRRFVLAIDELDRLLTSRPLEVEITKALQRLLQVFLSAGSFVVLCGLPEFRRVLDADVTERIGHTVTMPQLTGDDVVRFIAEAQAREAELPRVDFQAAAVEHLVRLVDGNARRVIQLCHELYRVAVEEDRPVDLTLVETELRKHTDSVSVDDVTEIVRELLEASSLGYIPNHYLGVRNSRVQFWLDTGTDSGVAVLIVDSVLASDIPNLLTRVNAVREARATVEVVLVVTGLIDPAVADDLNRHVVGQPLRYDRKTFAADFQGVLRSLAQRFERLGGTDPMTAVREWMVRLTMQYDSTHALVERIGRDVERLSTDSESQYASLRDRVNVVNLAANVGEHDDSEQARRFPAAVAKVFQDALAALDRLGHPDALFDEILSGAEDTGEYHRRVTQLQNRLAAAGVYKAAGILLILRRWVVSFSNATATWFVTEGGSARDPGPARSRFDQLCRAYERVAETMPLNEVGPLVRLVGTAPLSDTTVRARIDEFRTRYQELGGQVRRAVLAEISLP